MAYARTSEGPAGRPGACIFQIPPKLPSLATSYLEIAHWSILLRGIEGHGPGLPAGIRFYLHKEFRAAGIRILSTQRIGGGDLEENGNFL